MPVSAAPAIALLFFGVLERQLHPRSALRSGRAEVIGVSSGVRRARCWLVADIWLLTLLHQNEMSGIGDDVGEQRRPVIRTGAENEISQHFGHFGQRSAAEIGTLTGQFPPELQIVNVTVNAVLHDSFHRAHKPGLVARVNPSAHPSTSTTEKACVNCWSGRRESNPRIMQEAAVLPLNTPAPRHHSERRTRAAKWPHGNVVKMARSTRQACGHASTIFRFCAHGN